MKLAAKAKCPIHARFDCCGREQVVIRQKGSKWETVRPGVRRILDEHADHPDGYRYRLSKSAMGKVLLKKVSEQDGKCADCGNEFEDMREVTPDHIKPRGLGGARRDDRESNIRALCGPCNTKKGSKRIA